jgi:hypothetical protein
MHTILRHGDSIFLGLFKPSPLYVNPFQLTNQIEKLLNENGFPLPKDINFARSAKSGRCETVLRSGFIENDSYDVLLVPRVLRYFDLPANAIQVDEHDYAAFSKRILVSAKTRWPAVKPLERKFSPDRLRTTASVLLKYKLYTRLFSAMSAEEIIEAARARGILDKELQANMLCDISRGWGKATGLLH